MYFRRKHIYSKERFLLTPTADMEVTSEGSGPLPQVDLSVVYKRLRSDGFFKKEKDKTKACSVRKHSSVSLYTPALRGTHLTTARLLPPAQKRS